MGTLDSPPIVLSDHPRWRPCQTGKAGDSEAPVEMGGGGGHNGGMDDVLRRITALESDMKEAKAILLRLEPMIVRIDERTKDMPSAKEFGEVKGRVMQLPTGEAFGELKGKLAQVPNWWQLFIFIFAAVSGATWLARILK